MQNKHKYFKAKKMTYSSNGVLALTHQFEYVGNEIFSITGEVYLETSKYVKFVSKHLIDMLWGFFFGF